MLRSFAVFLALVFFLAIASPPLHAGTSEELEKKLIELQQEYQQKFEELKREIGELKKSSDEQKAIYQNQVEEIKKATKEKEEINKKELETLQAKIDEEKKRALQAGYDNGFYIKSADDQFMLKLGGYLQTDLRVFEGGEESSHSNTFDLRRARIGVSGYLFKNFEYKLEAELNPPTGKKNLTDAYLNVNYTPLAMFRVGQFKKQVGYESPLADNNTDFIEKALIVENVVGDPDPRDIGAMIHGALFEKRLAYYLGFFNGTGANATNESDNFTFTGRFVVSPFAKTDNFYLKGLSFGGSLLSGSRQSHSSSEMKLAGRNKVFNSVTVNGQRFIAGPELVWYIGPFGLKSEYYFQKEKRNDIVANDKAGATIFQSGMNNLITQGYYISAMYMLTGEERGAIITPKKNFDPATGGLGAWEVLARYEYLDLDKEHGSDPVNDINGDPLGKDIIGNRINVLGNTIKAFTLGLNWYLNKSVLLKCNYVFYDFDKKNNLKNTDIGNKSSLFLTRFQVTF